MRYLTRLCASLVLALVFTNTNLAGDMSTPLSPPTTSSSTAGVVDTPAVPSDTAESGGVATLILEAATGLLQSVLPIL